MESDHRSQIFQTLTHLIEGLWKRNQEIASEGVLSFPRTLLSEISAAISNSLEKEGISTYIVSYHNEIGSNPIFLDATRNAAKRGCKVTRYYLIPHKLFLHKKGLINDIECDKQSGINVVIVYIGEIINDLIVPPQLSLDFSIWDNNLLVSSMFESFCNFGDLDCRISIDEQDIKKAVEILNQIIDTGEVLHIDNNKTELNLEEPMVQTAPLMGLLSEAVCSGSYLSSDDCSWYHGVWQYLRLFDLVSTPTWHSNLYFPNIRSFVKEKSDIKILISGTADYSMLAHVLWALKLEEKKKFGISVVDLCQTPLIMCQWYARSTKSRVKTFQQNILDHHMPFAYDLIVTDAFLTRFNFNTRRKVVSHWGRLLSTGGLVITTVRIHGTASDTVSQANEDQIKEFKEKALIHAGKWRDFIPECIDTIGEKAEMYARRMQSYGIASTEEVIELFESNNFNIRCLDEVIVKGEMAATEYVDIVAEKK